MARGWAESRQASAGLDLEYKGWFWWKGLGTDLQPLCTLSGCSLAGRKRLAPGGTHTGGQENTCSPPYLPDPMPILFPDEPHPSDAFPEQPQPPPMSIQLSVICVSKGTPVASEGNPGRIFVFVLPGVTCRNPHLHGPTCLGTANPACGSRVGRSPSTWAQLSLGHPQGSPAREEAPQPCSACP